MTQQPRAIHYEEEDGQTQPQASFACRPTRRVDQPCVASLQTSLGSGCPSSIPAEWVPAQSWSPGAAPADVGLPSPQSTLCGCDRSPGSGNTPTRSLAGSVSPHSACALAGEKTARVKEKKYFSDSEEETASLGPCCCGFQDTGLWRADASLRSCVSSASGLSQVWGQSWRGQTQCPELLWGAVHTQSQVDGALWPASPQQHQQRQRGLSSWGAGVPEP